MSVKDIIQNLALPYRPKGYVHSFSGFSNVNHMFIIRRVLGFELRFTQANEFTGNVLIALILLRYVYRMHRTGFTSEVFLPGSL